ncbi:MAG: NAD(P)/FAD-dependent oxidoreductase [Bacteroidota bacterium]
MNIPESNKKRIVIIGGGFAGLTLGKKLRKSDYQVILIDRNNFHTFQPLLYQVATAGLEPDSITYPIRKVFQKYPDFYFRMAEVEQIDADQKTVQTNLGNISYDYLVIATGARSNFFGNDQVKNYSMPMKSIRHALDLRSLLLQNFEDALVTKSEEEREKLMNVVIVGAGPTGVELAGALAELKTRVLPSDYPDLDVSKMKIVLIDGADRVLPAMSEDASRESEKFLTELGVEIKLNLFVNNYDGHIIDTSKGDIPARTLIWSAGVFGNPIAGITMENKSGRYDIDEYFRVKGVEDVYALGDVASIVSEETPAGHPMLASVAVQQGEFLAKNFRNLLIDKEQVPFKYNDKGSMATIGKNKAVADLPGFKTQGMFAWYVWMFVHLILLIGFRNRLVAFMNWVWAYITYDTGVRLIIRPFTRRE